MIGRHKEGADPTAEYTHERQQMEGSTLSAQEVHVGRDGRHC